MTIRRENVRQFYRDKQYLDRCRETSGENQYVAFYNEKGERALPFRYLNAERKRELTLVKGDC